MPEVNYRFESRPSRQLLTDTVTNHMMKYCSHSINVSYAMVGGRIEIRTGDFLIGLCVRVDGIHILMIKSMEIINTYLVWGIRRAEQKQRDFEVRERSMRYSSPVDEPKRKVYDYSIKVHKGEHTYRGREKARENFFKLTDIEDAILLDEKNMWSPYDDEHCYNPDSIKSIRGRFDPNYRQNDSEFVIIDDPEGEKRDAIKMKSEREKFKAWYDEAIEPPSMKDAKIVTGSTPNFVPKDAWDCSDDDNINNLERELAVEQGKLGKFFKEVLNIRRSKL